jgi:hypothetical protein
LEIVPQVIKCDKKVEKKWDKAVRSLRGAATIQNRWRGYLARKKATFIRQTNAATLTQRFFRGYGAKIVARKIRRKNAAVKL